MPYLDHQDIRFFKENGYLIKRDVLKAELMARARQRMWDNLPLPLVRDKPGTWVGPFADPLGTGVPTDATLCGIIANRAMKIGW